MALAVAGCSNIDVRYGPPGGLAGKSLPQPIEPIVDGTDPDWPSRGSPLSWKMVSRRFGFLVVPLLSAALLGCQVDSYLTCGAPCDPDAAARRGSAGDAARTEGGEDASEEGVADARPRASDATANPDARRRDGAPDDGTSGDGGGDFDGRFGDGSPRVGVGGSCSPSTMCTDDAYCGDAGICAACLKAGSACTSNRQCCSESCGASGCNAGGT
jgi:hypothetical protein